jgi:arylsulfatase A-like enzyme
VTFLGPAPAKLAQAPNLILFSLDTLGASYLGRSGHADGVSPNIDAFLEESFSFERAYTQYPGTLVAHTSLFTGLHPARHGRYDRSLDLRGSYVAELAQRGYLTAAFTENANVGSAFGFAQGFDRWDDGEGQGFDAVSGNATTTFGNAEAWLEQNGRGTRFFLFVHTYEVHSPYAPPDEDLEVANALTPEDDRRFSPKDLSVAIMRHNQGLTPLPARDVRRFEALYTAEVRHLDRVLGHFLEQLALLGLERDTLVVLTSDHGEQFGQEGKLGHGQTLHNRVLHVPLGFRWPGRVQTGRYDGPVGLVDVMPTVVDLAELPSPGPRDGRSLAALLRGETKGVESRPAFAELQRDRGECQSWIGPGRCWLGRYAVQTDRYKYVSSEFPRWERLYDLVEDPDETRDIKAERPDELARHQALLADYRSRTGANAPALDDDDLDALTRDRLEALGYIE